MFVSLPIIIIKSFASLFRMMTLIKIYPYFRNVDWWRRDRPSEEGQEKIFLGFEARQEESCFVLMLKIFLR